MTFKTTVLGRSVTIQCDIIRGRILGVETHHAHNIIATDENGYVVKLVSDRLHEVEDAALDYYFDRGK